MSNEYVTMSKPNLDYLKPRCGENKLNGLDMEDLMKEEDNEFEDLKKIKDVVMSIVDNGINNRKDLNKFLIEKRREHKRNFSLVELQFGYRVLCENGKLEFNQDINNLFQKKRFRSQSGVMVVAVLTSPYPDGQKFSCEYDCWYCPAEPDQPRSYLLKEPGVLRANRNKFDCVKQMWDRLRSYHTLGHPTDKLEIIVLGGTWSSYPLDYRRDFIRDIYYAANNYHRKTNDEDIPDRDDLATEMKLNQVSKSRVIGLTIETRPDRITPDELKEFRKMGVTRVQIGVQHTNDRILKRINRRCSTFHTIKAIKLLKDNGFKVDIHIMPNLPKPLKDGVSHFKDKFELDDIDQDVDMIEEDKIMFDKFLFDPDFSADQWKIYPCEVVPWTRLKDEYERGVYLPYAEQESREMNELHELLMNVKSKVPIWVRLNRVIRDIPAEYIIGGPKDVSMRQLLEVEMKKRGMKCKCIRCREVKKQDIDPSTAKLFVEKYEASGGDEYFITFETPDREILFGFLRLRLSKSSGKYVAGNTERVVFEELVDCAMIRELHVYGQTTEVNRKDNKGKEGTHHQHVGFGTMMVNKAFEISESNGYKKISVISGEGVKPYYERFGFREGDYYMISNIISNPMQSEKSNTLLNIVTSVRTKIMKNKRVKELNSKDTIITSMESDKSQVRTQNSDENEDKGKDIDVQLEETETLTVTFDADTGDRKVVEASLEHDSESSVEVSYEDNNSEEDNDFVEEVNKSVLKKKTNNTWKEVKPNVTNVVTVETSSFIKGEESDDSISDDEPLVEESFIPSELSESKQLTDEGKFLIKLLVGMAAVYALAVPFALAYGK